MFVLFFIKIKKKKERKIISGNDERNLIYFCWVQIYVQLSYASAMTLDTSLMTYDLNLMNLFLFLMQTTKTFSTLFCVIPMQICSCFLLKINWSFSLAYERTKSRRRRRRRRSLNIFSHVFYSFLMWLTVIQPKRTTDDSFLIYYCFKTFDMWKLL